MYEYFLHIEALTLEKYAQSVHIFNLQMPSNAINILSLIFLKSIPKIAQLHCKKQLLPLFGFN